MYSIYFVFRVIFTLLVYSNNSLAITVFRVDVVVDDILIAIAIAIYVFRIIDRLAFW